jgi:hypothetical protein
MEINKLTTREELKTYFETDKYPTQNQFSDLIDSLRHKEDILTSKEVVILANSLASIDNGYILYSSMNHNGDLKFPIVVSQQDSEDQLITLVKTETDGKKQYFFGNPPYTIKTKEFPTEVLDETEYYVLSWQINTSYQMFRLFGNNLPTIPDGFELGTLEGKRLILQIYKMNLGQKIDILNTNIKFVNKTEVPIEYRVTANYWNCLYTNKDIITNHYNISDYLYFYYKADLQEIDQSIECKLYDADNDILLTTSYLNAGQNNQNWEGGQASGTRNIRIECSYQDTGK